MNLRLFFSGILLVLFSGFSATFGQSSTGCRAYEQELKVYFEDIYQSGQSPRMDLIENAWSRCPQPTQMMRLLYYYFKSVDALSGNTPDKRMSYMDANYMYDLSVREFDVLVALPKEEEPFAKLFIQRAQQLEDRLAGASRSVGFRNQGAAKGQRTSPAAQEDAWQKTTLDAGVALENLNTPLDRGQGSSASNARFDKNYLYEGIYQPDPWQETRKDENLDPWFRPNSDNQRERYGVVGDVGDLNVMAYIRFQNERRSAEGVPAESQPSNISALRTADQGLEEETITARMAPSRGPVWLSPYQTQQELTRSNVSSGQTITEADLRLSSTTRGAATTRGGSATPQQQTRSRSAISVPTRANTVTNLYDPVALRALPNQNAPSVAIGVFGETFSLVAGENAIVANGVSFMKVRNDLGQEGWVEKSALVSGGRLATVVRSATAYTGQQTSTAAVALEPTQLVVLADIQGNWVKGYSEHGESILWFNSIDNLSIDPNEVAIAQAFQEAKRLALMASRKAEINRIRQMSGYNNSVFRPFIDAYMKTL